MKRNGFIALGCCLLVMAAFGPVGAQKLQYGTAIKDSPVYYLPAYAAAEKGFWQQNGLEAEWVPFASTALMHKATAGGTLQLGMDSVFGHIPAQARSLPSLIIANVHAAIASGLYVASGSKLREAKELEGTKISVTSLGGTGHAMAQLMVKAAGIKNVKYVAIGTIPGQMAALKAGILDVVSGFHFTWLPLMARGELRMVVDLDDYLKGEWVSHAAFARKEFVASSPEVLRRWLKAVGQALDFISKNKEWTVQAMVREQGMPLAAAEEMYKLFRFTPDGKLSQKAVENVVQFLVEFGLVPKEQMPPADKLFTRQFTG